MAGLKDQFEHFYALDEDAVKTAIENGLVVPDTNVLLNLYRFQAAAREDLFRALEGLKDRLWIPHQVGLEFHRRRLDVIAEQEDYFSVTAREIKKLIDGLREKAEAFPTRIGLGEDRAKEIRESIGALSGLLNGEVTKAGKANEVRVKDWDSDKVLHRLEALFDGRVGEQMQPDDLQAARQEAQRRVDARLPPGYEDAGKVDPAGDYLIFRQLMDEAGNRKLPVVLVTDDEKPDWYRKQRGKPLGARPELREEMMAGAGVPLLTMTTEAFLRSVRKYLDFSVDPGTLDQARKLPVIVEEDHRAALNRRMVKLADLVGRLHESGALTFAGALSDEQRAALDQAMQSAVRSELQRGRTEREQNEQLINRLVTAYLVSQKLREQVPGDEQPSSE